MRLYYVLFFFSCAFSRRLRTAYPMVLRYLVAFALWEAANSSLVALSTSFLIFELDFTSQEVCVCVCGCGH